MYLRVGPVLKCKLKMDQTCLAAVHGDHYVTGILQESGKTGVYVNVT